jgi:hypothetical protein
LIFLRFFEFGLKSGTIAQRRHFFVHKYAKWIIDAYTFGEINYELTLYALEVRERSVYEYRRFLYRVLPAQIEPTDSVKERGPRLREYVWGGIND